MIFWIIYIALLITLKDFHIEKITNYFITENEILLINLIAVVYGDRGENEKAICILYNIINNVERNYTDAFLKTKLFMIILYNLSKYLGSAKKYHEAVEICDKAINFAIDNNNMASLPQVIYNKAYCLFYLEDIRTCTSLLHEAYYSARMIKNFKLANHVFNKSKENFGIDIVVK